MGDRLRLVCFEGGDGAGKTTQAKKLCERIEALGRQVRQLKFPDYESLSSGPVRLYLEGKLSPESEGVNPYQASVFFAADRICSFKKDWESDYQNSCLFVTDRYTTSNLVFQTPKLPEAEREEFLAWVQDLEYDKTGLPRPDLVIYLDLPARDSGARVKDRSATTGQQMDIHEKDVNYQNAINQYGRVLAQKLGWVMIDCTKDGALLSAQEVGDLVWEQVKDRL